MSKKKWFVTVTLMRGVGEQHMFIKLDIEQAIQFLRMIEEFFYEYYKDMVNIPVNAVRLEEIIGCFEDMKDTYEYLNHMEQSGLD